MRTNQKALRQQGLKYCSKCEQIKSISEYFNNEGRHDKLSVYCKPCEEGRIFDLQKVRETKKYKKIASKASMDWVKRNPNKKATYDQTYGKRDGCKDHRLL